MAYGQPLHSFAGPGVYGAYDMQMRESLTWSGTDNFDVRVLQSMHSTGTWPGNVSLREMLGASLVTFDRDVEGVAGQEPLRPKAVYVQYPSTDPVTGGVANVLAPAHMSLDVYADPSMFAQPPREESPPPWEPPEDPEPPRPSVRDMRPPVRARPRPDYCAWRHEYMIHEARLAKARQEQLVGQRGAGARGTSSNLTMSSFMKSVGKDKYSKSRMSDIDTILRTKEARQAQQAQQEAQRLGWLEGRESDAGSQVLWSPKGPDSDAGSHAGSARPATGGRARSAMPTPGRARADSAAGAALAAELAVTIPRLPTFFNGGRSTPKDSKRNSATSSVDEEGGDSPEGAKGEEDGAEKHGSANVGAEVVTPPAKAPMPSTGQDLSPPCVDKNGSARSTSAPGCTRQRAGKRRAPLRDLDPHLGHVCPVSPEKVKGSWPHDLFTFADTISPRVTPTSARSRNTSLLGKLQADRKKLSKKY